MTARVTPRAPRVLLASAGVVVMAAGGVTALKYDRPGCSGPAIARAVSAKGPLPPAAQAGQLLVAHDGAGDASIVDLATGTVTYLDVGLREPHETAVSADGRWGVMSDFGERRRGMFMGNRVAVIDMRSRRLARIVDLGENRGAHGATFVPGRPSRALVTTQSSRRVVEVDVEAGTVVRALTTGADGSHLVATSPDGRFAFTGNEGDGTVTQFDLATGETVARFPVAPRRAEGIAVTPDGRELWVGGNDPGTVYVVDLGTRRVVDSLTGFSRPDRLVLPPGGGRALVMDVGCVHVADVRDRRVLGDIVGLSGSFSASPDGAVAFMPSGSEVAVVDLAARRELVRYPLRSRAHGVAWGPRP